MSSRMLSVQSHVVSGYCGNKSATFPLQLLGFEVDVLNSVQLSNHTQYKQTKGHIFDSNHLKEIHEGLHANDLLKLYDNVLSGYVADVGFIKSLSELVQHIKHERDVVGQPLSYTLDPVLGDIECGFYVPAKGNNMLKAYQEYLLPLANIITPNAFEASLLTGIELPQDEDNLYDLSLEIIRKFHDLGVEIVALTSVENLSRSKNELTCFLSCKGPLNESRLSTNDEIYSISIPKIPTVFYGTGDLFAALLTGWIKQTGYDVKESLENTVNTIQCILGDTYDKSLLFENRGSPLCRELRIIQNKDSILKPPKKIVARKISLI